MGRNRYGAGAAGPAGRASAMGRAFASKLQRANYTSGAMEALAAVKRALRALRPGFGNVALPWLVTTIRLAFRSAPALFPSGFRSRAVFRGAASNFWTMRE